MAFKTFPPPGTPPGTLTRAAGKLALPAKLTLLRYDADHLEEHPDATLDQVLAALGQPTGVTWIHLQGLGNLTILQRLGEQLDLHPLALEDVSEGRAPIKVEDYGALLFIVCRLVTAPAAIRDEQVSLFLGNRLLFSIQESHDDYFAVIRERLRHSQGAIRHQGADYLAYAILDLTVDYWFPLMEVQGERLEALEEASLSHPDGRVMHDLQALRRDFVRLRRLLWPQREVISTLMRPDNPLISEHTRIYLRDCYDHAFQVMDLLENYRDMAGGIVDIYLSNLNTRLNEIMKVLTIIATIFIPLNFLASLYGMNFKGDGSPYNMPELTWYFGYPFALGLMALAAGSMIFFFHRKGWL